ncbi:MAG TPA: glycerol-3-phosphate dehydrogenase/oxidase [Ramlibacter sp.]|nr:glycerol-3-phosphate dehydrogenase/oxidase [Ramlibacter sp.]
MRRHLILDRLAQPVVHDLVVVGGGATGLGVALDAAARGLKVALVESHDFAGGTSSRATKLVHGGVRYLAQGRIGLVREALRERTLLLRNAPHLAQPLGFVMPAYRWWEAPFYGAGLKLYDVLAGDASLGSTAWLPARALQQLSPMLRQQGLKGGILYWDGQFDDARLALALARTAAGLGALLVNYCPVTAVVKRDGRVSGVRCHDAETGREFELAARCVVNATGVWVDGLRQMDGSVARDGSASPATVAAMVAPSQGVHLVVDREFLPGPHAVIVPRTADGRVLFAVPWLGKVILGTTDTPRDDLPREPRPFKAELSFLLQEAGRILRRPPTPGDIRSAWVGLRPLVRPQGEAQQRTQAISREHSVTVSPSGLVTVTGGKWTTYRAMAQDVLAVCEQQGLLPATRVGLTASLRLAGAGEPTSGAGAGARPLSEPAGLHLYGSDADAVNALPGAQRELGGGLTEAMVRFAVRHEWARCVEDVLARRSRLLFLDAQLAGALAAPVADILRGEGIPDPGAARFEALATSYLQLPTTGA